MRFDCDHAFERAVVLRTLHAARVFGVCVLHQLVVGRIEVDLANVGDRSHQRAGKSAAHAEPAAAAHRDVLSERRHHDHIAGLLVGEQVDERPLSREDAARRECGHRSEAGAAHRFDAAVAGLQLVGGHDPTGGGGAILRAARRCRGSRRCGGRCSGGLAAAAAPAGGGGGSRSGARNPDRAQCIDQARIDRHPFALHHPGVGGHRYIFSNRFDQSVTQDHRPLTDDGAADRDNPGVVNRDGLRGLGESARTHEEQRCDELFHKSIAYYIPLPL